LRPGIGLGFFEGVLVGEKIVGETEEEIETLLSGFGLSRLCLKGPVICAEVVNIFSEGFLTVGKFHMGKLLDRNGKENIIKIKTLERDLVIKFIEMKDK
jgi:hypothetical protein